MHYNIVKETKPNLKNYGRYKAVAVHYNTIDTERLCREIQNNCTLKKSDVKAVLSELSELLVQHLQDGDRVRLDGIGMLKLEIESDKVDPVARERKRSPAALRRHPTDVKGTGTCHPHLPLNRLVISRLAK